MTDPSSPLLVLVQSRIRTPSETPTRLSPSVFNAWYDTAHIPDLLQTPGVRSALRYATDDDDKDGEGGTAAFPYIALYPSLSRAWLTSPTCEFLRVPLHHPMLPGPSNFIFDVADFVMGAYVVRATAGEATTTGAAAAVVVEVVGEEVVSEKGVEGVLAEARKGKEGRSAVLEYEFSPAGKGVRTEEVEAGRVVVGARFLVVHLLPEVPEDLDVSRQSGKGTKVFQLLKAFGEETQIV